MDRIKPGASVGGGAVGEPCNLPLGLQPLFLLYIKLMTSVPHRLGLIPTTHYFTVNTILSVFLHFLNSGTGSWVQYLELFSALGSYLIIRVIRLGSFASQLLALWATRHLGAWSGKLQITFLLFPQCKQDDKWQPLGSPALW